MERIFNDVMYLVVTPNYKYSYSDDPTALSYSLIKNPKNVKMQANAILLRLDLKLPSNLFKRPQLNVSIEVPEGTTKPEIKSEQLESLKMALNEQLDMSVNFRIVEPEKEQE